MTDTELGQLLRRLPDDLDPTAADRILGQALEDGARRRRTRHRAVAATALSAAAVVAVATATVLGPGSDGAAPAGPDTPAATATASATTDPTPAPEAEPTVYAEGSETQVPGGPVIATTREVAGDAALADAVRALLPPGDLADLEVSRTWSSNPSHQADHTRDGRVATFSFDGAQASVTIQRWDGYAAVGIDTMGQSLDQVLEGELVQKAATTAREACAGSYQVFPPIDCTAAPGGYWTVSRPYQGDAMPSTYQELLVGFFTDDGYVVLVDSYNTPAEKGGPPVAERPVLSVATSLAMAQSDAWFD